MKTSRFDKKQYSVVQKDENERIGREPVKPHKCWGRFRTNGVSTLGHKKFKQKGTKIH